MLATALIVFFFVAPIGLALISGIIVARLGAMLGGAIVGFAYLFLGGPAGGPLFGLPLIIGFVAGAVFSVLTRR